MASLEDTNILIDSEEIPEPTEGREPRNQLSSLNNGIKLQLQGRDKDVIETRDIHQNDVKTPSNQPIDEVANQDANPGRSTNQNGRIRYEDVPVCYSSQYGVAIVRKPVVETQTDGSCVIVTPQHGDAGMDERPIRAKDIKCVKIFSIITIIVLFPFGIPAFWFALKAENEFHEGMETDEMERVKKNVKRSERLVLFGIVIGVLTYILIFAIVERHKNGPHDHSMLHWIH